MHNKLLKFYHCSPQKPKTIFWLLHLQQDGSLKEKSWDGWDSGSQDTWFRTSPNCSALTRWAVNHMKFISMQVSSQRYWRHWPRQASLLSQRVSWCHECCLWFAGNYAVNCWVRSRWLRRSNTGSLVTWSTSCVLTCFSSTNRQPAVSTDTLTELGFSTLIGCNCHVTCICINILVTWCFSTNCQMFYSYLTRP